jgi:hypothetical protein
MLSSRRHVHGGKNCAPTSVMRRSPYRGGMPYRPMLHWPYERRPGDFLRHWEDLHFYGFTRVRPFYCIFTDPVSGMLNLQHKNLLNKIHRARRLGRKMFKNSRPFYKSRARIPDEIEAIRYRAALNRSKDARRDRIELVELELIPFWD